MAAGCFVLCSGQRHEFCFVRCAADGLGQVSSQPTLTSGCRAGFAAQSILAALGSVQFVSNVLFAWLVLQEKVRLTC